MRQVLLVVLTGTVLADCSGGITNRTLLPTTAAVENAVERADAQFAIRWPGERKLLRTARGSLWISPSSASVIIQINDDPRLTTRVNAPNITGRPVVTKIDVDAPVGRDRFTFMLYDQRQKNGTPLVGNLVGQAAVVQGIVAGEINRVRATITGVVGEIGLAATPNQPFVSGDSTRGFVFIGDAPNQQFIVTAKDMDGNTIVPQPTKFKLKALEAKYFDITQPDLKKNPQVFLVTVIGNLSPGATIGIVASTTDASGNTAQTTAAAGEASAIYVAYRSVRSGGLPIAVYNASTGTEVRLPSGAFSGLRSASALAYDYVHHHLLVGDTVNGVANAYDGAGNQASNFAPISVSGIKSIAYDYINQEIYVNGEANGVIGISAYTSNGKPVALPLSAFRGMTSPGPLAFVWSTGNVVSGQSTGNNLSVYTRSGSYVNGTTLAVTSVLGLATDYFSSGSTEPADVFAIGTPQTGDVASLFDVTPGDAPVPIGAPTDPRAIAQDPDSATLYVASGASNEIVPVTYLSWTTGTRIPSASGYSNPVAITIAY